MNQQQKKYTVKRMQQLMEGVADKLREKYTTESVTLTLGEKYDQIKNGKAKLVPKSKLRNSNMYYSTSIGDLYIFKGEVDADFDRVAYNTEVAKYVKELSAASDEVMLGDSTAALKMLKDFTDMCNKVK
jgi:hypothetical protein